MRHEISAGGIIYRRRGVHIEIFFIKDPYGRWTFPKGHQESGETLIETAIREIEEETGLSHLRFIAPIGRTSFHFRQKGHLIQKAVHFFLFEALPTAQEKMTGEGAIWEASWIRAHQAFSMSGYRNLDRLLSKALRLIAEQGRRMMRKR
ncbi:MAG: NUDIX domain-containing protein [Candidatus Uhrbacteria bacterium]|nr:NUDIX domain-containing protein [Candidatus Uhrbacteria bacterium]